MKMKMLTLRSMSRTVHEGNHKEAAKKKSDDDVGASMSLTVWKKSLMFSCNGFTVFDSNGNIVYRVDNYNGRRPEEEVTLMDGLGKPVLSVRRHHKKFRLQENWLVYEGDVGDDYCTTKSSKKPLFCVKKHNRILIANSSVLAHIYRETSDKRYAYVIEGSYTRRSCKVLDESRTVVAEIKRKDATNGGGSFGVEVFVLMVQPGFDGGFAMALVLLLDQMF